MTKLVNGNMLYIAQFDHMLIGVGPSIPALQKRVNEFMDLAGYKPADKWREEWHEYFPLYDRLWIYADGSHPNANGYTVIKLVEYYDGELTLAPVKERTQ